MKLRVQFIQENYKGGIKLLEDIKVGGWQLGPCLGNYYLAQGKGAGSELHQR